MLCTILSVGLKLLNACTLLNESVKMANRFSSHVSIKLNALEMAISSDVNTDVKAGSEKDLVVVPVTKEHPTPASVFEPSVNNAT